MATIGRAEMDMIDQGRVEEVLVNLREALNCEKKDFL